MQRTPEPELMTDATQVQAYARADFAASDAAFVARFVARYDDLPPGPLVDLGCGPGNITFRLARALPGREVVGVDGSAAMLDVARGLAPPDFSLRFEHARLPAASLPAQAFAAVVCNSLLHHLPDPMALWHTIARVGLPGAAVWIGDLRRPASPTDAQALVDIYAADAP